MRRALFPGGGPSEWRSASLLSRLAHLLIHLLVNGEREADRRRRRAEAAIQILVAAAFSDPLARVGVVNAEVDAGVVTRAGVDVIELQETFASSVFRNRLEPVGCRGSEVTDVIDRRGAVEDLDRELGQRAVARDPLRDQRLTRVVAESV